MKSVFWFSPTPVIIIANNNDDDKGYDNLMIVD